jgi:hypothetical protein
MASKYQILIDIWNSQKEFGRWKTHRSVKPDIKKAIDTVIREGWEVDDIASAIVNLAACYHSKETRWTYGGWTLAVFLTVKNEHGTRKWEKFTDNNYREDEWLTKEAIRDRIKQRNLVEQGGEIIEDSRPRRKPYAEMDEMELEKAYECGNTMVKHVISKIRQGKA